MKFAAKLKRAIKVSKSLVCVGLDPDPSKIPQSVLQAENPVFEFASRIIAATAPYACAYKLNFAFFESLGGEGWKTLREVLGVIPPHAVTIADAKRGDIGNSADKYAAAILDDLHFDAVTVNAYMGRDCVAPFIARPEFGAFILALTSNAGSKDFQYLKAGAKPLFMHVVAKAREWNVHENCGLVVGATHPEELRRIRKAAPDMPLLIPGVGAQGGDLESVVRYGCDAAGSMAIINASRSIIYASKGDDFAEAAGAETARMRAEINAMRKKIFKR